MEKRPRKTQKTSAKLQDLVVAALTEDLELAKDYEILLKNNEIPVLVKKQKEELTDNIRIAIMVPEEFIDEAHVVIESQNAYDDFYDFAADDQDLDDSDFESGFFEDDF